MIRIIEITDNLREEYNNKLLKFEQLFTYPLGGDNFVINHGKDYFKFFDLLGRPYIMAIVDDEQLVGVAIIILRNIDILNIGKLEPVWYICDLKIHPNYRGKFIIHKVFHFAIKKYGAISRKIYGISMNSNDLESNKLINLATRIPALKLKQEGMLLFFLINNTQLDQIITLLNQHYSKLGYCSLMSVKNLIMSSTSTPIPLIHLVPGGKSNVVINRDDNNDFMFCVSLSNKPLIQELDQIKIQYVATASVISNITGCNWSFISSNEV